MPIPACAVRGIRLRGRGVADHLDSTIRPMIGGTGMLVDRHPAGGHFEIVSGGGLVALRCHWPFDSDHDEWIDIENTYHAPNYLRAVDDAMTSGNGLAHGVTGGLMRVTSLDNGFFLEFSRPQSGWSASSLRLHVRRPIADLLPAAAVSRYRSCPSPRATSPAPAAGTWRAGASARSRRSCPPSGA